MIDRLKKIFSKNIPEEFLNIESLKDAPNSYFERGKKVHVINNLRYFEFVHKGNGGYNEEMSKCVGQICTVSKVDSDMLIYIRNPSNAEWLVNRSVLTPVIEEDESQSTKLFTAMEKDDMDGFFDIIKNEKLQINLNVKNKEGRTLLNLACCLGRLDVVNYLCESGADIGIPDECGNMPIHNCAINGHMSILKIIVNRYPESIHQKQENGRTLINIAQKTNNTELENYIKEKLEEEKDRNKTKEKCFTSEMLIEIFASNKMRELDKEPFTMPDPPEMSFLENPIHNKEKTINRIPIFDSVLSTLKLDNPPTDNNMSYPSLSLKIICKNCKINSVNYVASCGHCFCYRCIGTFKICPICSVAIDGKPLKIFV